MFGYFLEWLKGSQRTMEIRVKYFDSSQGDDDVSKLNLRCWDMKRMCGYGKSLCTPKYLRENV